MVAVTIRFASDGQTENHRRLPRKRAMVDDCALISNAPAIKPGPASWGDFRESSFANCVISGCHYGLCAMVASSTASIMANELELPMQTRGLQSKKDWAYLRVVASSGRYASVLAGIGPRFDRFASFEV
jgi:hypothetical protein